MGTVKNRGSVFDDEFEVTYEEEIPFKYSFDTKPADGDVTDKMAVNRNEFKKVYDNQDDYRQDAHGSLDYNGPGDYEDLDNYDTQDDYDYYSDNPKSRRARRSGGAQRLLSPVKKTAKYGTKAIYSTARLVVRVVSELIFAGTLGFLAYEFWRGAAPYGDPQTILTEKNYTLASYAAVAAIVLLFEFIAFLWSLTRLKIREGRKIYKEDTGRGLFSFIFLYIASYLSFLLCSFLPDSPGSYAILKGIRGALDVFGALHNVLLGLCLAGVISCFIRRNMN